MNRGDAIVSLFKLTVASASTGVVSSPLFDLFTRYMPTMVWNIPVGVVGAAGAGAVLSLFFGDPLTTRRDLFGQTIAATFFGVATAVLAADALDWEWAAKHMPMFAMMSAAMIRWFLPTIIERGKHLIKEFKFSFAKKSDGGDK